MRHLSADELGRARGLIETGVPVENVARLLNCGKKKTGRTIEIREVTCYHLGTGSLSPRHPTSSRTLRIQLEPYVNNNQ
ncbi:hypothetical protein PoB_006994100 [Plakobranchus ocellatus]|uniref:Helix-turn-helix domain-containing protein n=1 Tax=Plakobranchus ocellatus TaxID=259542 RepID=A0AAV4DH16_9GAST|nr:hypothetical protein PoB_006994100 [Plakobranchus ocellatus]